MDRSRCIRPLLIGPCVDRSSGVAVGFARRVYTTSRSLTFTSVTRPARTSATNSLNGTVAALGAALTSCRHRETSGSRSTTRAFDATASRLPRSADSRDDRRHSPNAPGARSPPAQSTKYRVNRCRITGPGFLVDSANRLGRFSTSARRRSVCSTRSVQRSFASLRAHPWCPERSLVQWFTRAARSARAQTLRANPLGHFESARSASGHAARLA